MASTQATLSDYFKSKRGIRDVLDKNVKSAEIIPEAENNSAIHAQDVTVIPIKESSQDSELRVVTLSQSSQPKPSRSVKSATRKKKQITVNSSETIQDAFRRVAKKNQLEQGLETEAGASITASTKRSRACVEEEEDKTEVTSEQLSYACSTPTKNDMSNDGFCHQSKKHKAEMDDVVVTPEASKSIPALATRASARKKLIMDDGSDKTDKEKPSVGGGLQLNKCKKLSELRAQLLKVRQCENKLQQFRSSVVEPAQREAEQAAALVAKANGNMPSPRKNGSSLKMMSPRKMFSPHKELSSPYKAAPSPRHRSLNPLLEHFSSLEVEVPVSPVKTPIKSPGKELAAVPAHERYHHLVQDASSAPSSELALPYHYRLLREVFRAVDTVVSLMYNRQEVITFSKLKPAVQQMLRRTFQERNLGQLSRVFPLAYFFRQDKVRPGPIAGGQNNSNYQLTISANLNYKDSERAADSSATVDPATTPCRNLMSRFDSANNDERSSANDTNAQPSKTKTNLSAEPSFRKMDSLVLVERRSIFHQSLVNIVHQHHLKFLKGLEPSVEIADVSSIKRWHPHFPLDEVPEVDPAPLPQPPSSQSLSNAADVLNVARGILHKNPRLEAAVVRAAEGLHTQTSTPPAVTANGVPKEGKPAAAPVLPKQETQSTLSQKKDVALALKGISVSLLEKIRAREAAAASRVMVRSAADTRQLEVLSRLPEVARILRHTLVAEKRAALHWDAAVARLRESHSGMLVQGEVEEHLEVLLKEMPQWITKHKLSSGIFIKLNKTKDINDVVDQLQAILKQRS